LTGNKHNFEGMSGDKGEPDPGPYWRRMHTDWRFWVGALLMFGFRATIRILHRKSCKNKDPD
jgi:hypothetical protein